MFDPRNNLAHQVADEVKRHFHVFDSVIPRNVRLSEAPSHGKPALLYDVQSKGAQGYLSLARELLARESAPRDRREPHERRAMTADPKRRALGRGLDALLPAAPPVAELRRQERLHLPAREDRPPEGPAAAALRRAEARRAGAEHPRARPRRAARRAAAAPGRDKFELIAGERRWRALQRAGLREALVVVKDVSAEGRRSSSRSSRTSSARTSTPSSSPRRSSASSREHGYTQEALAERARQGPDDHRQRAAPAQAAGAGPGKVVVGELSEGHARALLGAGDCGVDRAARRAGPPRAA